MSLRLLELNFRGNYISRDDFGPVTFHVSFLLRSLVTTKEMFIWQSARQHLITKLPYRHIETIRYSSSTATPELETGAIGTDTFKVMDSDLAAAISPNPKDVYAKVLATPRVCGFMEIVAARMLVPYLKPGQLSVGTRVDLQHLAATPVDEMVTITAKFLGKEGKVFKFDIVAEDRGGEVGRARHERAVIDEERLISGANKRLGGNIKI